MSDTCQKRKQKFIVDINLGRLARWLRLLGYDTLYYKNVSLFNMSRIARREGRIYLTRSRKNAQLKIFNETVLINSNNVFEQLKELVPELQLCRKKIFSRCSLCNQELVDAAKERVKHLVPEYVYASCQAFKICRKCGRIYWQGTHNRAMLEKLEEIFDQER